MASLSEQEVRNYLKERYPNSRPWRLKVDVMPKEQAFAIYMRLQKEDKNVTYIQGTLF